MRLSRKTLSSGSLPSLYPLRLSGLCTYLQRVHVLGARLAKEASGEGDRAWAGPRVRKALKRERHSRCGLAQECTRTGGCWYRNMQFFAFSAIASGLKTEESASGETGLADTRLPPQTNSARASNTAAMGWPMALYAPTPWTSVG
jgi:hypothetical protein